MLADSIHSDFHGRVHKAMSKQLAQLLEPHRPLFIEEPLLPGHPNELKDLYNKTTIPIAVSLHESFKCSIDHTVAERDSSESGCSPARTFDRTLSLAASTSSSLTVSRPATPGAGTKLSSCSRPRGRYLGDEEDRDHG